MSSKTTSSSGIGIPTALTLIFVVLKLIGTIDWSWWWVLSPIWISIILFLVFILAMAALFK